MQLYRNVGSQNVITQTVTWPGQEGKHPYPCGKCQRITQMAWMSQNHNYINKYFK